MANSEQITILQQGVEAWNQWHEEEAKWTWREEEAKWTWREDEYPSITIRCLSIEIDLREADLRGIDLRGADLSGGVNLSRADLSGADLRGADLSRADLSGADLPGADLRGADLSGADLSGADLRETSLSHAKLSGVDLRKTFLSGADLRGADLSGADLSRADLRKTFLSGADLRGADLSGADLRGACLETTKLIQTNLCEATLTGAELYGTARDDWKIEGIICDYVFWDNAPLFLTDEDKLQWHATRRTPKDRDFRPDEFEELYKQLPIFEYAFEHGFTALDAVVMDRIVAAINEQHPEFELKLDSFHSRGQPNAKFTVLHKEYIETAKSQITNNYENRIAVLEDKYEHVMNMFNIISSGRGVFLPIPGGMNLREQLPIALTQQIMEFLVMLPNIDDRLAQRAFLQSAGLDTTLIAQLHVGEPSKPFMELLISNCMNYSLLADGRHSLIAVMEAAKQMVGIDKQVAADALIQQITAHLQKGQEK